MAHTAPASPLNVLIVYGDIAEGTTLERSGRALVDKLRERGFAVISARSAADGVAAIQSDPLIACVLVDVDLDESDGAASVLQAFRERNDRSPVFLFGKRSQMPSIPLDTVKLADEFLWLTEDTPTFMAGRVEAALQRYHENLLPPMFASMLRQARVHEYAFGTPGHLGGTAFLKTSVSKIFFDYFGENMFRSDLSIGMVGRTAGLVPGSSKRLIDESALLEAAGYAAAQEHIPRLFTGKSERLRPPQMGGAASPSGEGKSV